MLSANPIIMSFNKLKRLIPARFLPRLWYHRSKGKYYARKFGYPAKDMTVIAVTGTDGKTTTCGMLFHCLKKAGKKVGMLTTTSFAWNDIEEINETHKTSLSPKQLNHYLARMKHDGVKYLILEASSHALDQGRLADIPLHTAILTNLAHEHLDYHKSMKKYRSAKSLLFKNAKYAVINGDDPFLEPLYHLAEHPVLTFGQTSKNDLIIQKTVTHPNGVQGEISINEQNLTVDIPLFGAHNIFNAVACLLACETIGIEPKIAIEYLKSFSGVPGRMEKVNIHKPFTVLVDYAVTPQAFKALFETARQVDSGRLIAVFGACGDRDREKRPILGQIASELCDKVIITDEEPYHENPAEIREMIALGIPKNLKARVEIIADRKKAIEHALTIAAPHDVITVSGMGNQTSMVIRDEKIPWSDREVVKELGQ